jgi:hypothetical protein
MILLLRGHIRDSFDNNDLYNLVADISDIVDDLEIYVQTWSVVQSGVSWREIEEDSSEVTEYLIENYFRRLNIKNIIILDDSQINLIGETVGYVSDTKMPKLGWKNMFYGMYHGINCIKDIDSNSDRLVLNMRFDILSNLYRFSSSQILEFIETHCYSPNNISNVFLNNHPFPGCDNAFIGTIKNMHRLVERLHSNLDEILLCYPSIFHQEYVVFYENEKFKAPKPKENVIVDIDKPTPQVIMNINSNKIKKNNLILSSNAINWAKFNR